MEAQGRLRWAKQICLENLEKMISDLELYWGRKRITLGRA